MENVSAYVLRTGVAVSAVVMLLGIFATFIHSHLGVQRMRSMRFETRLRDVWQGAIHFRGQSLIEAGIYILVLTPIMRVLLSMVIFLTVGKDRLYAGITLVVLLLTLAGLLWLG